MKPVPQYRASCRFVYAPCAVLTNSVGTVSRTPDYSGDRSHIVSRLNVYATLLGFKRAVGETCVKSCLQYGVAQDKVARAIDTVELSMVDDSIPLFEVAAISDDKRVATDVVRCYIDALAQFDQLEQEERVAEGLKMIEEGVRRKKREVAKIDAKIASVEVSDKLNLAKHVFLSVFSKSFRFSDIIGSGGIMRLQNVDKVIVRSVLPNHDEIRIHTVFVTAFFVRDTERPWLPVRIS